MTMADHAEAQPDSMSFDLCKRGPVADLNPAMLEAMQSTPPQTSRDPCGLGVLDHNSRMSHDVGRQIGLDFIKPRQSPQPHNPTAFFSAGSARGRSGSNGQQNWTNIFSGGSPVRSSPMTRSPGYAGRHPQPGLPLIAEERTYAESPDPEYNITTLLGRLQGAMPESPDLYAEYRRQNHGNNAGTQDSCGSHVQQQGLETVNAFQTVFSTYMDAHAQMQREFREVMGTMQQTGMGGPGGVEVDMWRQRCAIIDQQLRGAEEQLHQERQKSMGVMRRVRELEQALTQERDERTRLQGQIDTFQRMFVAARNEGSEPMPGDAPLGGQSQGVPFRGSQVWAPNDTERVSIGRQQIGDMGGVPIGTPPQHGDMLGAMQVGMMSQAGLVRVDGVQDGPKGEGESGDSDEDRRNFEPQIDRAKMKTKLCKYQVQTGRDDACPFWKRHGWCAFAHGEHELMAQPPGFSQQPTTQLMTLLPTGSPSPQMNPQINPSGGPHQRVQMMLPQAQPMRELRPQPIA
eukprot:Hpha_TRINITY_DN13806_c0_g2::TRINITY_DN13806_c0_g2_i1::g.69741::m.69741